MLEITDQPGPDEGPALNEDAQSEIAKFRDKLAGLTCRIQLSAEEAAALRRQGPLSVVEGDSRRFVRFACFARGILECRPTLPVIPRQSGCYLVLVKNISRSGIGFLHEQQLLPRERCELWVEGRRRLSIEITRCRRLQDACYEVGARFV